MMTQVQAIANDELSIAQTELEQYVTQQANAIAPFDLRAPLKDATQDILRYAEFLASEKTRSRTEYKQLLSDLGWKGEEKKYLKVAAAFENFSPQDLAAIEPATIFQLANNPKKYQPVIDEMLDLPEITQATVRELIQQQHQPRERHDELLSIWRRTRNGGRYCQIPPIHEQDEQTGVILQRAMDDLGLLPQAVVREAMELWQDYQDGRLVPVEAAALPKEMPIEVEPEVQHEDLLTEPWDMAIAIPDLAAEQCSVEEFESVEQCVGDSADNWTFEPEPELDDDTVKLGDYAQPFSLHDVQTSLSPVELLIHTFQTAADWSEISSGLKIHGEYKPLAWEALTPLERRRVMEITPSEIKKLNEAKKSGKIVNFYEVYPGVYKVQIQGHIFWKDVSSSTLDTFLMEL